MKKFGKASKLENVRYDVRGPVVDEANRMIEQGIEILKLNIGNPAPFGFNAPDQIIESMISNLRHAQGYSDSKGVIAARQAILEYCQLKKIQRVTLDDIYIGNGVSELILIAMQGLLSSGDEILIPSPDYPLWTAAANLAGGKPVHYVCDEQSDWYPDIEDIRSKITNKTKGIVIINPNNPTGALYPKEVLEEIAEIARQNGLIVFSDEIYDRLVMDGLEHTSIAAIAPDVFVVTFSGLSKSHLATGFRSGWMVLSGEKTNAKGYIEGLNILTSMRLCSNVPGQYIIPTALKAEQTVNEIFLPGGRIYEQREYIYNALKEIPGISVIKPKAAFYIFPKVDAEKFNIKNDEKFVLDFLKQKHILVVNGSGFNWKEPNHFRIVYLPTVHELTYAMEQLRDFLYHYKQM